MIDYDTIEINGKKIKAYKSTQSIWDGFDRENMHIVCEKIIYELPITLYEKIPRIVDINSKRFYKADINKVNQSHFKLIEM